MSKVDKYVKRGLKLPQFRSKERKLGVEIAMSFPDGEICLCNFI